MAILGPNDSAYFKRKISNTYKATPTWSRTKAETQNRIRTIDNLKLADDINAWKKANPGKDLGKFINGEYNTPTPGGTGSGSGSGYGYGYGGGGGGGGSSANTGKAYIEWAAQQGYNLGTKQAKKLLQLAMGNDWSIGHFARLVRLQDTKGWIKSAAGKQEARDVIKAYHQWFPNLKPTAQTLRSLYKYTKGLAFSSADLDSFFRTTKEFKTQFKYISDKNISADLANDPVAYRKYLDSFKGIYSQYFGTGPQEQDIKYFFTTNKAGVTPGQFEENVQAVMPYKEAFQKWEGSALTDNAQNAALYNGKNAANWKSKLLSAAKMRNQFLTGDSASYGMNRDEFGVVKQQGI